VKQYFEEKGDTKTNKMNIAIPATIRFSHYGTWEKVKFENKFAPMPMTIPLVRDLSQSLVETHKVTSRLRSKFGEVYATYAMTYYSAMFFPHYLMNFITSFSTKPYTMAFSNTPGLLKPILFEGRKSIKMFNHVLPAGHTGMALSCLSYVDYFKIGCVTDENIMKDPQHLIDLIEANLKWYMEEGKRRGASTNGDISKESKKDQ
jgi:WS/DGAT C-terminal domain